MAMTTTVRAFPPGGAATSVTVKSIVGLVGYSASSNGSADIQQVDKAAMNANGWPTPASAGSGTTAQRPPAQNWGLHWYIDTTLGAAIWSDGQAWRKIDGTLA